MPIIVNGIKVSYDYEDLLHEFRFDAVNYIDGKVFIERKNGELYNPIIDWYYSSEQIPHGTRVEVMTVDEVIAEMEELMKIL